jgi:hypothetical protein
MRNTAIVLGTAIGAGAVLFAGGCSHPNKSTTPESRQKQDLRAQSEGRLEVDQSAVLPVDVRSGVMREYPGATVQNVTKKTDQGQEGRPGVRYQVELTTKDGKRVTREFDDKGKALGS